MCGTSIPCSALAPLPIRALEPLGRPAAPTGKTAICTAKLLARKIRAEAQRTVDSADMRYSLANLHRLRQESRNGSDAESMTLSRLIFSKA